MPEDTGAPRGEASEGRASVVLEVLGRAAVAGGQTAQASPVMVTGSGFSVPRL